MRALGLRVRRCWFGDGWYMCCVVSAPRPAGAVVPCAPVRLLCCSRDTPLARGTRAAGLGCAGLRVTRVWVTSAGPQVGNYEPVLRPVASFALAGNVASLSLATFSGSAAEAVYERSRHAGKRPWSVPVLVMSFADAKMSFVHFDRSRCRLRTLCMLNFETEATGPGAWCATRVRALEARHSLCWRQCYRTCRCGCCCCHRCCDRHCGGPDDQLAFVCRRFRHAVLRAGACAMPRHAASRKLH